MFCITFEWHVLLSRYHNGTLLDRNVFKYEEDLVLRGLKPDQTGHYYCKASSQTGSSKSSQAFLTVIGMYRPYPSNPILTVPILYL